MKVTILKAGGNLSAEKANIMLHDGTIRGKKITDKQRKYFGYIAGGGNLKAIDGVQIEGGQYTPITERGGMLSGPSHGKGGIDIATNGQIVEAEGKEGIYKHADGTVGIFSKQNNTTHKNPITGNPFATDFKKLIKKEAKLKQLGLYAEDLLTKNDPYKPYENLKFEAGKVMLKGAIGKLSEVRGSIKHLGDVQEALNQVKEEKRLAKFGANLEAKKGLRIDSAQGGKTVHPRFSESFKKLLENAPSYVKEQGYNIFSLYRDKQKQIDLWEASDKTGKFVASPGHSSHEFGIAGDLQDKNGVRMGKGDKRAEKWMHDNARSYGLEFRLGHEGWHMELSPDAGASSWVGDYHAENYDANPNNNIAVVKGSKYKGKANPKGLKTEELSNAEKYPPYKTIFDPKKPEFTGEVPYNPKRVKGSNDKLSLSPLKDYNVPSDAKGLPLSQVTGEIYAAAANKQEPVWLQQYKPQLYQPYQVSLQDKRNQAIATLRGMQPYVSDNPAALATLAAQNYDVNDQVGAEEFRINQGIFNDITNKNISLLNDAQSTNLKLADTQYTRQAQAKSNTKATNQAILNSVSSKLAQNQLEQRTLQVYENMYPHYRYGEDNKLDKVDGRGEDYVGWNSPQGITDINDNMSTNTTKDRNGNISSVRENRPSNLTTLIEEQKLQQLYDKNSILKVLPKKNIQSILNIGYPHRKR